VQEKDAKIAQLRNEIEGYHHDTRIPNWPFFFPVAYINIQGIQDSLRRRQVSLVFWLWGCMLLPALWHLLNNYFL